MNYLEPCQYSIRLTEKLKSLDTQNVLDFELINKAIYWARKYHGVLSHLFLHGICFTQN